MRKQLLDDRQLEATQVVANARMNRGRGLRGVNSYEKELRFSPLEWLREVANSSQAEIRWLDLCCGNGQALLQAAAELLRDDASPRIRIQGVDLIGMFAGDERAPVLRLTTASLHSFSPDNACHLITCVHGLHYIGDKLGLIQRITGWLAQQGLFVANLDLENMRLADGSSLRRKLHREFRRFDISYDGRRHLLACRGPRSVHFPYAYIGADPAAGPTYTCQDAVDSYYEPV
jgi:predicted TPR repeat methyltransferase